MLPVLSKLIKFRHKLEHSLNPIQKLLQQTWVYFCTLFQPFSVYGYTPFSMLLLLKLMTTATPPCVLQFRAEPAVPVPAGYRSGDQGLGAGAAGHVSRGEANPHHPAQPRVRRQGSRWVHLRVTVQYVIRNVLAGLIFAVFAHRRLLEFKHIAMLCAVNEITLHKEL